MSRRILHAINDRTDPVLLFTDELQARGFEVVDIRAYAGEALPETLEGFHGIVAGGGVVDTHQKDEHTWLAHEIELMREGLEREVPIMGLCLGSQLLTEAAGGTVYRCDPPEVGWHRVEANGGPADDPLFGGLPRSFAAFEWHYYACELPSSAIELMRNSVASQAMRFRPNAWATQFHIEVTRDVLERWQSEAPDELAKFGYPKDAFLASLDEHLDEHVEIGRTLARRFADQVAAYSPDSTS
jgi:GMP synthase (glutamine-hydrolysing)